MDAEVAIGYFPNLKMISTRSAGYDHHGFGCLRAKRALSPDFRAGIREIYTVAEYAFQLLLNLTGRCI